MKATKEQIAIIEAAAGGESILVQSYAGCAKTTSFVAAAKAISDNFPKLKKLGVAFNVKIKTELQERLTGYPDWEIRTLNSLGQGTLMANKALWNNGQLTVDDKKVDKISQAIINSKHVIEWTTKQKLHIDLGTVLTDLTGKAKMFGFKPEQITPAVIAQLSDVESGPFELAAAQNLSDMRNADAIMTGLSKLVSGALTFSINMARNEGVIDFNDQVYLAMLYCPHHGRSWDIIGVDEAQDLSTLNHMQVLKACKKQLMVYGDKFQSLYGFRGATSESMEDLFEGWKTKTKKEMTRLKLSITFRCPQVIVQRQERVVGIRDFKARPVAGLGTVFMPFIGTGEDSTWDFGYVADKLESPKKEHSTVVLSATNAPLYVAMGLIWKDLNCKTVDDFRDWCKFMLEVPPKALLHMATGLPIFSHPIYRKQPALCALHYLYLTTGLDSEEMAELFKPTEVQDQPITLSTVHRCVHPDTWVETLHGRQRIKDISTEGRIRTSAGFRPYYGLFTRKPSRAYKITTKRGYNITVSPEHGMTTWDGEKEVRTETKNLGKDDWLRLKLGATSYGKDAVVPTPKNGDVRESTFKIPTRLTPELSEFLGFMVADGTIFDRGFRASKAHLSTMERFEYLVYELFGIRPHVVPTKDRCHVRQVNSTQIVNWLRTIGGMNPNAKTIPDCIYAASIENRSYFLKGLFEDSGTYKKGSRIDHICLTNISEELLKSVQLMLLDFHIVSSRTNRISQGIPALYCHGPDAFRFAEQIGFMSVERTNEFIGIAAPQDKYRVLPISRQETNYLKDRVPYTTVQNARARGTISLATLNTLPNDCPFSYRSKWFYDRIVSIEEVDCETMCVTVPEGSRFIQDGFDGWNSKGLEWDHVYLLEPSNMGETGNLRYVAETRTRNFLGAISFEDHFRTFRPGDLLQKYLIARRGEIPTIDKAENRLKDVSRNILRSHPSSIFNGQTLTVYDSLVSKIQKQIAGEAAAFDPTAFLDREIKHALPSNRPR